LRRTVTGRGGPSTVTITCSSDPSGGGATRLTAPKIRISEPSKFVVIEIASWLSPATTVSARLAPDDAASSGQDQARPDQCAAPGARANKARPA
jgi:hypothetical protein